VQTTLLGELLENAKIGALAIESGRCVAANAYACELTGYARGELIGKRVGDLKLDVHAHEQAGNRIRRKDGGEVEIALRACETMLGGLSVTLAMFELF